MKYETQKLINTFNEHGFLLVGVDFDDTVFPYTDNKYIEDRCAEVRDALLDVRKHIVLCLYTVSDQQTMKYKMFIMRQWGLDPDYINESKVSPFKGSQKPFFNLLLDDKAGLNESLEILKEFTNHIKSN